MKSRILSLHLFSVNAVIVLLCSANAKAQVLNMTPGSHFVVNGSPSVILNSAAIKNNGTFSSGSETVYMTGYSDTTVSYIIGDSTTTINNLTINKSSKGVALKGSVGITNVLTMTKGNLYADSALTLKSSATNTARVAAVPSNCQIVGKATVERYVPAKRSWRLMTAPVTNSNSIYNSWQNGGVYQQGKGTLITGPSPSAANGLDASPTNSSSMKTFNASTQGLSSVTNTNASISQGNSGSADNTGYFIFVRGDRSPSTTSTAVSNSTTLSSTGNLQTGTQVFTCASGALKYTLIGNPYASPIDLNKVTMSNVIKRFIMWDPTLNQVGGYVVLDDILNVGSFTKSVVSSVMSNQIQSGQAFFVQTLLAAPASVTISESSKSTGTSLLGLRPDNTDIGSMTTNLYLLNTDSTTSLADGTVAQFREDFDTAVNWQDARKFGNVNESFGLLRSNAFLAIERRPTISSTDTLFFKLTAVTARNYQFEFIPDNMAQPGLTGFLVDNYLGTSTPINLDAPSKINFSVVSGVAASSAFDRFKIVFNNMMGVLPVTFSTIKAYQANSGIAVEWNVENELNIMQYEVERSADGKTFTQTNITIATGNHNSAVNYNWIDTKALNGANYYRIKSVDRNGTVKYSQIVKVTIGKAESDISVFPNPVTDNVMNIQFSNEPKGDYIVNLVSSNGQLIYTKGIAVNSNNTSETIKLRSTIAKGTYELKIDGPAKSNTIQKIIIQ